MLTESERNQLLLGDPNRSLPQRLPLSAGPLSMIYENGDLRFIRFGEKEIVRRIYATLRGEAWLTVPGVIHDVAVTTEPDGFFITYQAQYTNADKGIDFAARFALSGKPDGTVTFDFDGEAKSTFKRNRIGICVLHPAQDCAGRAVTVTHTDGTKVDDRFPVTLQPQQPFFDIAALTQEAGDGVAVTIRFSGDVFEMEDQRNYSDASFKTYSTPQALPKPVEVTVGSRIHQTITITVHRDTIALGDDAVSGDGEAQTVGTLAAQPSIVLDSPVQIRVAPGSIAPFPGFGLTIPAERLPLPDGAEMALGAIRLEHLRLDVDVTQSGWQEIVQEASRAATAQELPLFLGLKNFEKMPLSERSPDLPAPVAAFLFLSQSGEFIKDYARSRPFLPPGAPLIVGSSNGFIELNRNRPDMAAVDGIVYASTPQVHSFDETSIMETPPMYAEQLVTARTFAASKPVLIGPLTLYRPGRAAAPQQKGIFGAAWYVAALSYAAQGAAAHVTLCDVSGDQGIVSDDGTPYPAFYALSAVGTATGGSVQGVTISDPLQVACLAVLAEGGDWQDIFLANLQPTTISVHLTGIQGTAARVRMLDETTGGRFSGVLPVPVEAHELGLYLLPYAVVQVISGSQVY